MSLFHGIAHFYLVSKKKEGIFSERRERRMAKEENSFFSKLLSPKAALNFDHLPDTFPDSQTYTLRKRG